MGIKAALVGFSDESPSLQASRALRRKGLAASCELWSQATNSQHLSSFKGKINVKRGAWNKDFINIDSDFIAFNNSLTIADS